jgi:GTPase SAR1 family protein
MTDPQTATQPTSEYEVFQRHRKALSDLIARLIAAVDRLGVATRAKALVALLERLESDRFKVMVLGEFKRGKSTFINALLGEEVLPSSAVPCTAVINEVKWGEEKRAVLHFRSPLPPLSQASVPAEILHHLERQAGESVPPLEVPIERLERYVAIPEPEKDQAESVSESPYSKVEIFWPLDLCRNDIEIIDSPGLNENVTRARVSKDYVATVDAILFVMSCSVLASESELAVIDNDLRGVGHEYLFFICNRFDEIRPADRTRLQDFGRRKLMERTELREGGVFFLSALLALEGRLQGDADRVARSGMPELERALTRFLTHDRGKIKLLQPARELVYALDEARNRLLPTQRAMLDDSLAELEGKLGQMRPRLADAERSRDQILAGLRYEQKSLRSSVRLEFEKFLRTVADQLEGWVQELPLESKVKLLSFKQREQLEAVRDEICSKIAVRYEAALTEWKQGTLQPLIDERVAAMQAAVAIQVADFCARVDQARAVFFRPDLRIEGDLKDPSVAERAAVVIGGALLGDPSFIVHGVRFGSRGLGINLTAQFATILVCIALGISNPIALAAALVGGGAIAGFIKTGMINDRAKKEIGRALAGQFREELTNAAETVATEIYDQVGESVNAAAQGLNGEIQVLREQVDAIVETKRSGEVQVEAKRRDLSQLEGELRDIDASVKDLIFDAAGR